jgi:hypothetical protein
MKISNYDTATAFERPSVGSWLVVFVCGFLTVCILGPLLCAGLWLLGVVVMAMNSSANPAMLDVPVSSAVRIILQSGAAFGALLATVMLFESARRKRQTIRIQGHHALIGDFEHSPFFKTWHAQPALPAGKTVRLSAYGRGPSDAQAAMWERFIAQYDELIATATRSLLTPPYPLQECCEVTLTPSGITLTQDGKLHLGFEFSTVPENFWTSEPEQPYPTASFTSALELKSAEWLKPYGQSSQYMSPIRPFRPMLPIGWYYPNQETSQSLHAELERELPPGHLLSGLSVETFAWREGGTDDVLFRHILEPERFTVIHLSWLGRTEVNALHPTTEFDGTFIEFLAEEESLFGLASPRTPDLAPQPTE